MVQTAVQCEPHSPFIEEQLSNTFTQLLVLATDLIMDMLNRLGVSISCSYLQVISSRASHCYGHNTLHLMKITVLFVTFFSVPSCGVCMTGA